MYHWSARPPFSCRALKVLNSLHLAVLFSLKSLFFHWVVRTDPRYGARSSPNSNVQSRFSSYHAQAKLLMRGPSLQYLLAPRGELLGIGGSPSCSTKDKARCVQPATAPRLWRRELAEFHTALHFIIPGHFPSTLMRANGVTRVPDVHSSKRSWWKIVRASAPPWEPTPSCRIAIVSAAISPSLSAKRRPEMYFRRNSSI